MEKKKILIVHNYYQIPGGEDTVVNNEKQLLEDNGYEVLLYTRHNKELKTMGVIRKLFLPFSTIFNLKTYFDVSKIIKKAKIDVVHVHNTLNLISPAVYYASVNRNVPVVQTVHNFRLLCPAATLYRDGKICEDCIKMGLNCAIKHSCYRGSKLQTIVCVINTLVHRKTGIYKKIKYICLTEFNKEKLLEVPGIKKEQIFVKPNFTYPITNIKDDSKEAYLYIGQIEEIKGIELIFNTFSNMKDKQLILVEIGTELGNYKEKFSSFKNIQFLGQVDKETLSDLLSKTKAVIVVSQCYKTYKTFGMIVIEAFAAKTPVIVGNIGNVASLVEDGVNGLKFKYNSSQDLMRVISKFEQLDRSQMAENAYKTYINKYSADINFQKLRYREDEEYLTYVGRIDYLKGVDFLIQTWNEMYQRNMNIPRLVICGQGPLDEKCKELAEKNPKIEFKGFVSNEKIKDVICRSKALLLPTRWYEGFPMTILEAYSVGVPVIGTNIGNVGSIIENDLNGWTFEPDNMSELISIIVEKQVDISKSVSAIYKNKYSVQANYEILKSIYDDI